MRKFALLLLAVFFALAGTGCSYLFPAEEEILAPPLIEPEPIAFSTVVVERGDIILEEEVSAQFAPTQSAELGFEGTGGRVMAIHVKLGDEVKKGDLLIELESEDIQREIRSQQIEVEKATIALESLEGDLEEEDFDVTELEKARLDYELAQKQLTDLILDADKAEREYTENRVQLARQRDEHRLQTQKIRLTLEQLEADYEEWLQKQDGDYDNAQESAIAQARLELQRQQTILTDLQADHRALQLVAPIDGLITYVPSVVAGMNIDAYVTAFRISDPSDVILTYNGDRVGTFYAGMVVTITYKGEEYPGTVATDLVNQTAAEERVVNFVPDDLTTLSLGAMGESAMVRTVLREATDVIVVPKNVVNNYLGRRYVNILRDGVKIEQDVQIGIETATELEIVRGLEEGDEIIQN